ncbi:hypothetical protein Btru_006139 [Bulinus truncatus]|nr:hypothetical protein Btru_006139 [Bulinus truncatus]
MVLVAFVILMTLGEYGILDFKVQSQSSYNMTGCDCSCTYLNYSASKAEEKKLKAEANSKKIEHDLTVDKSQLSSEYWMKNSVPDDRPSAQGIGCVGVVTIISVCVVILIWDIPHFVMMLGLRCRYFGLNKIKYS